VEATARAQPASAGPVYSRRQPEKTALFELASHLPGAGAISWNLSYWHPSPCGRAGEKLGQKAKGMNSEKITTRDLSDADVEDRLIAALRRCGQQVTQSDLVVASGLPPHVVEPTLRRLLVEFRSSLAVTEDGELLYRFDPLFVRRSDKLRAFLSTLATVLVVTFKVITGVVLVLYVGVFVALAIPEVGLLQIIRASILGLRQPHRLRRIRSFAALALAKTVSLAHKVFAFIFGPSLPTPDEFADEKELLAFGSPTESVGDLTA
jgi:hypothetical protein